MSYLKTSQFLPITAICFVSFLLTFVSVNLSAFTGIILSFWLIMRGKPDGILGLFILYFFKYYFHNIDYASRDTLTLGGLPMGVEILASGFIVLRVFLERIYRPKTFRFNFPSKIFNFWVAAFLPVIIGFYLGYQNNNPNWTRGLRWLMIAGSYFYGYILARHWRQENNRFLIALLLPFVIIMLILMNLGLFWSHHGFLFLGFGGSFSIYYIRNRSLRYKILGVFLLYLSVSYALLGSIIQPGTLTMIIIVFLSILFSYLGLKKQGFSLITRSRVIMIVGQGAILWILIFSFGVAMIGYMADFVPSLSYGSYDTTFSDRILAKTASDRLIFWHAALDQILTGPYFIVPSSEPLPLLLTVQGLPSEWIVGAHNVTLETLRINGLFSGTIILIIYFLALKNNLIVLAKSRDPILLSLAAAVLSIGIGGMSTGDFPADMTVGVWLWSLAGLCHGLFIQNKRCSEVIKHTHIQGNKSLMVVGNQQKED